MSISFKVTLIQVELLLNHIILGRSTVNTNEVSALFNIGAHDNLIATATVITMDRLEIGDEIFVKMNQEKDGSSHMYSSLNEPAIHFVGHKISN